MVGYFNMVVISMYFLWVPLTYILHNEYAGVIFSTVDIHILKHNLKGLSVSVILRLSRFFEVIIFSILLFLIFISILYTIKKNSNYHSYIINLLLLLLFRWEILNLFLIFFNEAHLGNLLYSIRRLPTSTATKHIFTITMHRLTICAHAENIRCWEKITKSLLIEQINNDNAGGTLTAQWEL